LGKDQPRSLLDFDEPPASTLLNKDGASRFMLLCDHAGRKLPRRLGSLGLHETDLESHIAWDIGAAAVTQLTAHHLNAITVLQTYSRLVIDCNRPLLSDESIIERSDGKAIPGNCLISRAERDQRIREIFQPYHDSIRAELDRRQQKQTPTALIAIHSFTPVYGGVQRPWHIGIMFNRDARLAAPLKDALRRDGGLVVGDNEPYAVDDTTDHTIPVHGEQRGIPAVGIEIRQDLIADAIGQQAWAKRLASALSSLGDV
jgi:predicted N-formylglutamate amidohydrolase